MTPEGRASATRMPVESGFSYAAVLDDVDGDGRAELLAVFRQSGRLACFAPQPPPEARLLLSHYALRAQGREKTKRTYGVGDLQGDGGMDVVVAVYEGQVKLLRQLPPLDDDDDGRVWIGAPYKIL